MGGPNGDRQREGFIEQLEEDGPEHLPRRAAIDFLDGGPAVCA